MNKKELAKVKALYETYARVFFWNDYVKEKIWEFFEGYLKTK